jgi:hypothetical protein
VTACRDRFFELTLEGVSSVIDYLDRCGTVPLPPYHVPPAPTTSHAIGPSTHAMPAPSPRRPQVCISTRRCSRRSPAPVSLPRTSRCTSARARSSPCRQDLAAHTMHAEWYPSRCDRRGHRHARSAAAHRRRRHDAFARSSPPHRPTAASRPAKPRRVSHRAGHAFRIVDRLLTNFICRVPRC